MTQSPSKRHPGFGDSSPTSRSAICAECPQPASSTSPSNNSPNLGLWECEFCDKTLCNVCKNSHQKNTATDDEANHETGEAKHNVRPLQFNGKEYQSIHQYDSGENSRLSGATQGLQLTEAPLYTTYGFQKTNIFFLLIGRLVITNERNKRH